MEKLSSLQKLGFTENEIIIYLFLLKKGLSTGNSVYVENSLDKSSAYEALNNLQRKGVVYTTGKLRNQKFGAVDPIILNELLNTKENELKKIKNDLGSIIDNLSDVAKQSYKNRNIRIIDGKQGFKTWAYARLEAPKGSVIRDISSDELQQTFALTKDEYKEYSLDMPVVRAQKGIFMHGLMKKSDIEKEIVPKSINKSDPAFLKEVRLLPESIKLDCSLVTFHNSTSFLRNKDGEFFGLIIEDTFITSLLNSLIDFIWDTSPKI